MAGNTNARAWRISVCFLALFFLILPLVLVPSASAQYNVRISGHVDPSTIDEEQSTTITIDINNNDATALENIFLEYYIYKGTIPSSPTMITTIAAIPGDGAYQDVVTWKGRNAGEYTIVVKLVDDQDNIVEQQEISTKITVKEVVTIDENPLFTPIMGLPLLYWIIIIIVLVVVIAVVAVVVRKKRKARKSVDLFGGPVEGIEARAHWGKMPENFYKEKRERYAKLKPVGLTRDGRTILGNPQAAGLGQTVVAEAPPSTEGPKFCQKCGFEMPGQWKSCLKCDAKEVYEDAEKTIMEVARTGADTGMANDVLRQADAAMDAGNWVEADMFAADAKKKAIEAKKKHEAAQKAIQEATKIQTVGGDVVEHEAEQAEAKPKGPDNCTNCGMGMQAGWDKCPVCGTTVEQMLAEPEEKPAEQAPAEKPAPAVDEGPKCHQCGEPLVGGSCRRCNAERAVWNAEKKVKALRAKVIGKDLSSEHQLDLNEAVDLYEDAKGALMDGDYTTAIGLAGEAIDLSEELVKKLGVTPEPETEPPAPTPAPEPAGPKCKNCGKDLKPGWAMCPACESPAGEEKPKEDAKPTCPKCGKAVKSKWAMCPFCEAPLR